MYALRGVNVVDPRGGGSIDEDQTVVIVGTTIRVVGPTALTPIPDGMTVIDARGLFAVAGLSDLHTHIEEDDLGLFLANGVTTVREMNGSPDVLRWRREVATGQRLGPTIFTSGPLIAGAGQRWRHVRVASADEAAAEAQRQAEAGYDFLKVYDGLSREAYAALAAVGDERGLPLVGHIPETVGLNGVVDGRQHSIEHVEQLASAVRDGTHESRAREIVAQLKGKGVAVTPTLAAMEILSAVGTPQFEELFDRGEMAYAPRAAREWWATLRRSETPRGAQDRIRFLRTLTRSLADADVPVLVGTDTPNPLLVPGFSIHQEMAALVSAGLRPPVVLEAATIGAAAHLGADHEVGQLEAGFRADIVVVAGNPLENLDTLRRPRAVVVRGRWLSASDLDALLAAVAARR